MPPVAVAYRGTMYFEYTEQGWSESVWLPSAAPEQALASLKILWDKRLNILPLNARGLYARVAQAGKPRDKHAYPGPYPVQGGVTPPLTPPVDEFCNDVEFAQRIGLETADGRWATYFLRCIPDGEVEDRRLKTALVIPPPNATPVTPTTWVQAVANYAELLRKNTVHCREVAPAPAQPTVRLFELTAWAVALDRGMAKKNTGRPFGVSRGRARVG